MFVEIAGERIMGCAEEDANRTTAAGKICIVQFMHLSFSPNRIKAFREEDAQVLVDVAHENCGHIAHARSDAAIAGGGFRVRAAMTAPSWVGPGGPYRRV